VDGVLGLTPETLLAVGREAVVTADPARRCLTPGWVLARAGRIEAVGAGPPPPDVTGAGTGAVTVVTGDVVLPGLVSAHQHLVDALLWGWPTGPTFLDWLLGTYHAGLAGAGPDDCALAVAAVRAAGLAAGVTTVVDCWSVGPVDDAGRVTACAEASIEAHLASGGRTLFAPMFCEVVPEVWPAGPRPIDPARLCRPADVSLAEVEDLARRHTSGRLRVTVSPELPEMVTDGGFRAAAALARDLGAVLPVHLCASRESRAACGPEDLDRLGVLGPGLLGAHCTAVDRDDIVALGAAGVGVAHCPSASRALGATVPTPVAALRRAGARCGLGLDNASLHPGSDLFAEARAATAWARAAGDPLDAADALDLITVEAAAAAGLDGEVGALVPGLRADLILLDAGGPHWCPRPTTWSEALVTCARADDVRTVVVDGRLVVPELVASTDLDAAARRLRHR
jgi:5-methylthioadenosine/S-adenosylhomocysteine deaminase